MCPRRFRKALERITARARDEAEGHEALQLRALELMGKHHKLFTERHEHDLGMGIAERLDAALKRIGDRPDNPGKSRNRRADGDESPGEPREIPARGAARSRNPRKAPRKGKRARAR
jgi:hypothetical protein